MPPLLRFVRKIAIARSELPEDQRSAIRLPSEDDKWLEFGNHCNKERVPFIVYTDLECILRKTEFDKEDASSYGYQRHEALSIGLRTMRIQRHIIVILLPSRRLYNVVCATTQRFSTSRKNIVSANMPMETLSKQQWEAYCSAMRCHICEKPFALDNTRVRDHCHFR